MLLWFCAHSRLPVPSAARDPLSYVHLAFHINACYARRHGYRLLFLQLREASASALTLHVPSPSPDPTDTRQKREAKKNPNQPGAGHVFV